MSLLLAAALSLGLGRADPFQDFPPFPAAWPVPIGSELVVSAQFYRLAYFTTAEPPASVARFYGEAWSGQGLPVTVSGDFVHEGCVSAFSTRDGVQRMAILRVHGARTLVFLVVKNLWDLQHPPIPATRPEGALVEMTVSSAHEPAGRAHASLLASGLGAARAQVVTELRAAGFRLESERESRLPAPGRLELFHRRGSERLVTMLVAQGDGVTARLSLQLPQDTAPGSREARR